MACPLALARSTAYFADARGTISATLSSTHLLISGPPSPTAAPDGGIVGNNVGASEAGILIEVG